MKASGQDPGLSHFLGSVNNDFRTTSRLFSLLHLYLPLGSFLQNIDPFLDFRLVLFTFLSLVWRSENKILDMTRWFL